MSGYRPICDLWLLTRCKYSDGGKRYGGYLGGFPERARVLLGVSLQESLLHVCGGKARYYPYAGGFGEADQTMDIDESVEPDFLGDVRNGGVQRMANGQKWRGVLCDPPYSEEDAANYPAGAGSYPNPHQLLVDCLSVVRYGGRVGIIHYVVPRCPTNAKFIACVGVVCGFGNRIRVFSVFEKRRRTIKVKV